MMGPLVREDSELAVAVTFSIVLLLAVGVTTLSGIPVPDMVLDSGSGRCGLNDGRTVDDLDSDDLVG